jgi:hypothetical protein
VTSFQPAHPGQAISGVTYPCSRPPTLPNALGYRVVITGTPDIDCSFDVTLRDRAKAGIESMTSGAGAMVATAMRVVNAVPYVVAAQPGLISSVDLPLTIPHGAFNPA